MIGDVSQRTESERLHAKTDSLEHFVSPHTYDIEGRTHVLSSCIVVANLVQCPLPIKPLGKAPGPWHLPEIVVDGAGTERTTYSQEAGMIILVREM